MITRENHAIVAASSLRPATISDISTQARDVRSEDQSGLEVDQGHRRKPDQFKRAPDAPALSDLEDHSVAS